MASTAKEDTGQSSSGRAQAAAPQAAEDEQCPICLGPMRRPAFVTYCMHKFCLGCIQQWARARASCPVCRQPMEQLLHSVRGDGDYRECAVGPAARPHRRGNAERDLQAVMEAVLWAMQEQQQRWAATNRPVDTESTQRQETAPGPSRTQSQQAPAASHEVTPLRGGESPAGPAAAPLEPQNGTE